MSVLSETYDALIEQIGREQRLSLHAVMEALEPAFAAEGYRTPHGGPQRILVVRLDEIGDHVLTSAFLRELRRNLPKEQIDILVKPSVQPLLERCPYVDHVLVAEEAEVRLFAPQFRWMRRLCADVLWPRHYDACLLPRWDVDLMYATELSYLCGARARIGFSAHVHPLRAELDGNSDRLLTRVVLPPPHVVHEVEKDLYLLRAMGLEVQSDAIECWLAQSDVDAAKAALAAQGVTGAYIAVAAGTREGRKTYPPELLAQALAAVRTELPFVLLGGPGEEALGAQVAAALPEGRAVNLVGKTPLRVSAALVMMAQLYLGGDTGLTHIAAAAKRPIVEWNCHAIDLPVSVLSSLARFWPWQAQAIVVRPEHAQGKCRTMTVGMHELSGCAVVETHCIRGIEPAVIAAAAERLLGVKP